MNKELKNLNFNDLLFLDSSIDSTAYDFSACLGNGGHLLKGYCLRCEKKGCNSSPSNSNFILKNISHGASTDDVLQATRQAGIDHQGWHNDAVLFLMEGPSKNYDIYSEVAYQGYKKCPTKSWYWIHEEHAPYKYPEHFKGQTYGNLFISIVFTFRLRNAYLTNFVKCGLNDSENNYGYSRNLVAGLRVKEERAFRMKTLEGPDFMLKCCYWN